MGNKRYEYLESNKRLNSTILRILQETPERKIFLRSGVFICGSKARLEIQVKKPAQVSRRCPDLSGDNCARICSR